MKGRMNHLILIILIQLIILLAYASAAENEVEIEQHLKKAIEAVQQRRYYDAVKEYKAVLEISSDDYTKQDAQYWLGLCYYYGASYSVGWSIDDATVEFQKLIQKWPNSPLVPNAMYMIGRIYFGDVFLLRDKILYSQDADHLDKAIETFENLIKKYPHSDLVGAAYYMQVLASYLKGEMPSENEMGKATLTLLEGIEDNEREFRWLALDILPDFGEDGKMALLELFENSDDKAFKAVVALKLAKMGETSKKEEIFKMATGENDINIRAVATIALAMLQDKRATPLLVNYVKNSKIFLAKEFRYYYLFSEPYRKPYYRHYGKISIIPQLQRSEFASSAVVKAIVQINDKRKIQMLRDLMRDKSVSEEVQINAASVLTLLKDEGAISELRKRGYALAMDWAVLGPLDLTIIPPKSELRIDAQYPKYDGASEDEVLRWRGIQNSIRTKSDTLKFNPYLNIPEVIVVSSAVYLMTYINSPRDTDVKLVMGGSIKIVKVWVNNQLLHTQDKLNSPTASAVGDTQQLTPLDYQRRERGKSNNTFSTQLHKGKNEVVIEAWLAEDISLRVTDIQGIPIPGLSYSCPLLETDEIQ